jgi:hypothetical protein
MIQKYFVSSLLILNNNNRYYKAIIMAKRGRKPKTKKVTYKSSGTSVKGRLKTKKETETGKSDVKGITMAEYELLTEEEKNELGKPLSETGRPHPISKAGAKPF